MTASSPVFFFRLSLSSMMSSTTNSQVLNVVRDFESIKVQKSVMSTIITISYHIFILMSVTSLVFSSLLSLPTTVPLTTNSHVLNVVRHDRNINNSHADHYHHSTSDPSWRKFQPKWDILMSATSLVFSSLLSLPTTVPLTTNSQDENINNSHVGKCGIQG